MESIVKSEKLKATNVNVESSYVEDIKINIDVETFAGDQQINKDKIQSFLPSSGIEGVDFISNWKRYKRVTAKIVDAQENYVLLEVLTNREKKIYKEIKFNKELLDEVNVSVGNKLLFIYSKRGKEFKIEVFDNQKLIPDSDFPEISADKFKNHDFFKD